MISYEEFEKQLQQANDWSRLWQIVKAEVKRRGHWKNKNRRPVSKR